MFLPECGAVDVDITVALHRILFIKAHLGYMRAAEHYTRIIAVVCSVGNLSARHCMDDAVCVCVCIGDLHML